MVVQLMHVKCIHDLCSLLDYILIYGSLLRSWTMFLLILEILQTTFFYFGINSEELETLFLLVF
jgi:hypothetical protein